MPTLPYHGIVSFLTALLSIPVYKALFPKVVAGIPSLFFGTSTANNIMVWAFINGILACSGSG
jgi:hypothetical protein